MNFGTGPLGSCDPALNSFDYPYMAAIVGYPYGYNESDQRHYKRLINNNTILKGEKYMFNAVGPVIFGETGPLGWWD